MKTEYAGINASILPKVSNESVTVVITTFNDDAFLREALQSVFSQVVPADEVIVVDDGSARSPAPILQEFPSVVLIQQQNGGLANARNSGLRRSTSKFITFLDADDRFKPNALSAGLACFRSNPEAVMVFGGHHQTASDGSRRGDDRYNPLGADPYAALLTSNLIGMHGAVMFRRDILLGIGGYDEQLRRGEDYDLYLRLTQKYPISSHEQIIAEYRWHGKNMSSKTEEMLESILSIHDRHRPTGGYRMAFWLQGRRNWREWYTTGQQKAWGGDPPEDHSNRKKPAGQLQGSMVWAVRKLVRKIRRMVHKHEWPPTLGKVNFGDFASTRPVSMDFGWDRGTPVDRYYIQNFLQKYAADIKGRVLEIGDDTYSQRFGTGITQQDVLHVNSHNPKVTITGDIATPGLLPEGAFDCVIFTQTLQVIYEVDEVVSHLHTALKPGGVLLLTVPGISQIDRYQWSSNWCWSFTVGSIHRMFEKVFGRGDLQIDADGNLFAAICMLAGVVLEEVKKEKLDVTDVAYPVVITLRAQKIHASAELSQ